MPNVTFNHLSVAFPSKKRTLTAVEDFSLSVRDREFVCLLGPSGCGKSTVLNALAGFMTPTYGSVSEDDRAVTAPNPNRGVVFQEATLFPWLTVRQNVMFGPSLRREQKVFSGTADDIIDAVGLSDFQDRLPAELSGGMRQRAGLARTLVNDPATLLMDEPFGALDAQTRITMQELLLGLWERDRKTVIFVTHDIDEALLLGDRIVVMTARPGRIQSIQDVPFARPRDYDITFDQHFVSLRHELMTTLRSAQ